MITTTGNLPIATGMTPLSDIQTRHCKTLKLTYGRVFGFI